MEISASIRAPFRGRPRKLGSFDQGGSLSNLGHRTGLLSVPDRRGLTDPAQRSRWPPEQSTPHLRLLGRQGRVSYNTKRPDGETADRRSSRRILRKCSSSLTTWLRPVTYGPVLGSFDQELPAHPGRKKKWKMERNFQPGDRVLIVDPNPCPYSSLFISSAFPA